MLNTIKSTNPPILIAWVMSLFATLASIYFIEIVGNSAATLCWFERMLVFSVLLVLSVGIIKKDINVRYYVAPMVILGTISAFYQQLVHWGFIYSAPGICSDSLVCTTKFFELFGFVTQATLCLTAFVVVGICMLKLEKNKEVSN